MYTCRRKKRHKKSKNGPSGEVVEEVDDEEAAMLNGMIHIHPKEDSNVIVLAKLMLHCRTPGVSSGSQ